MLVAEGTPAPAPHTPPTPRHLEGPVLPTVKQLHVVSRSVLPPSPPESPTSPGEGVLLASPTS